VSSGVCPDSCLVDRGRRTARHAALVAGSWPSARASAPGSPSL